MGIVKYLCTAVLMAVLLIPTGANAAWVMLAEVQHITQAKCPAGFELISVEAGDADLLVCAPISNGSANLNAEQTSTPPDDGPQEGPKFN